jgi:hypothetical protein
MLDYTFRAKSIHNQGSEAQMDKVAMGMKHAVNESVNDLEGRFQKLGECVGCFCDMYHLAHFVRAENWCI